MTTILAILHVLVAVFMILVILLQAGKEGGMGGIGGGGSGTAFGGRGSQTFLEKLTSACAAIFMITSLSLAFISSRSESMVMQRAMEKQEKAADQGAKTPAANDQAPAPQAAPTPAPGAAPAPPTTQNPPPANSGGAPTNSAPNP